MQVIKANYQSPKKSGQRGFEDLECCKLALDIVVNAHALAKNLPTQEKYELAAQIRRSSKGITANIAEGYGRYHYLESLRFYSIARGELNETLSHFINARVLGYIQESYFEDIYAIIRQAEATLNGFMNFVRRQQAGANEYGSSSVKESPLRYEYSPEESGIDPHQLYDMGMELPPNLST